MTDVAQKCTHINVVLPEPTVFVRTARKLNRLMRTFADQKELYTLETRKPLAILWSI